MAGVGGMVSLHGSLTAHKNNPKVPFHPGTTIGDPFSTPAAQTASAAQAATEVLQQIMTDNHLDSCQIREIVCEVPPLVAVSLVYPKPVSVTQSQFSMQFALGCILAYGHLGVEHLDEGVLDVPKLQSEMRKITMIETASFNNLEYNENIHPEAASVKVITKSGIAIERFNGAAATNVTPGTA